jgi:hypothetical protein
VPCGIKFHLQFTAQHLAFELGVLTHVAADHLLDLPRLQQKAQPEVVHTGIVADAGEAFHTLLHHGSDAVLRDPAQAEATDHQGHVVLDPLRRLHRHWPRSCSCVVVYAAKI